METNPFFGQIKIEINSNKWNTQMILYNIASLMV